MLSQTQIEHVKQTAEDLFLNDLMCLLSSEESTRRITINKPLSDFILSTINDGGILFLSTWDDLASLWRKVRDLDDDGAAPWLMQTSVTFQVISFPSSADYDEWAMHLARAYGSYANPVGMLDRGRMDKNLAIDDDLADRVPKREEIQELFQANPWFMYLATLQLSAAKITADIINSNKHQLGRTGQGES